MNSNDHSCIWNLPVPKIMIISLKRFKVGRSKYGFGGGQKLDTLVEFPLEGLDMSPYIMSNQ